MRNFSYHIPTIVHFGRGAVANLPAELKKYGNKVLLVYGGGSIKRTGVYGSITKLLKENGFEIYELSGVEPNPRIHSVRDGASICGKHDIETVLAVGGGSSLDCAKMIAACASYPGEPWELVLDSRKIGDVLPVFAVPTLAATGSEMDCTAVISRDESRDKLDVSHPGLLPKCAILDPAYTFSASRLQTAAGTADIMSHIFETYFSRWQAPLQERMAEALLKTCIQCGEQALEDPENYSARASLLWAASWAINGLIDLGKGGGWSVHQIEHFLSAYHDITHGVGLAVLTPNWMRYILNEDTVESFAEYGENVWGISCSDPYETAARAIDRTRICFDSFGLPSSLGELGVDDSYFEEIAEKASARGLQRAYVPLDKSDVLEILRMSL